MEKINQLEQEFKEYGKIEVLLGENLADHTSFKIGGPAALFAEPKDTDSLCFVLSRLSALDVPFFVLGGGTNVVFSDQGFDGCVVSTKKLSGIGIANSAESETVLLSVGAGTKMNTVVNFCLEHLFCGLEEFAGLPGSAGGAAYMNARCFEKEISAVAGTIFWVEEDAQKKCFVQCQKEFSAGEWAYKKSPFTGTKKIITRIEFRLKKAADEGALRERARNFVLERKEKGHFDFPCAGSVFKNNRSFGEPTGKIIDSLGLKGRESGGAQIAPFHGNIIINRGNATCRDVQALVNLCKETAQKERGITLEEEIIFP